MLPWTMHSGLSHMSHGRQDTWVPLGGRARYLVPWWGGQDVSITAGAADRRSCPSWMMWYVHGCPALLQELCVPSPCVPLQARSYPWDVPGCILPHRYLTCSRLLH